MLMSATKIVIKYHFKIHSICICKAHLLSWKIHSAVHHVFSLEFVAVIFLVVIVIRLLKWNLMSGPDLHGARNPSVLQQPQGCFRPPCRGFECVCAGLALVFLEHRALMENRWWKDLEVSLIKVMMFSFADPLLHHSLGETGTAGSWELVHEGGMLNGSLLNAALV